MKTIRKVETVPVFAEYMPEWEEMEQGVLYIAKSTVCHLCLCGCGERVAMPLNEIITESGRIITESGRIITESGRIITDCPDGFGWILTEKRGKISITPSIGNYDFPCKSHYIITNSIANFV